MNADDAMIVATDREFGRLRRQDRSLIDENDLLVALAGQRAGAWMRS